MASRLFSTLSGLRDRIVTRVREVNGRTERGVLGAGTKVNAIVDIARGHIGQLHDLLARIGDSGLHDAIARQTKHVHDHGATLDRAVAHHLEKVGGMAAAAREIGAAAREIDRANAAARMLAMNARIESERAGTQVFKAIANEIAALSRAIVAANGRIQQLAETMDHTLPVLVAEAEGLRETVSSFTTEARAQIEHVDHEVRELKSTVEGNLKSSDGALAQIISASHSSLSALQFQDVCAQSLLQIDAWYESALREAATELGVDAHIEPASDAVTREDGSVLDSQGAGDVLLF